MERLPIERQKLLERISSLPSEALPELANFLDYLCYKSSQKGESDNNVNHFLRSIAGLGDSGQDDISERDEEILHVNT